MPGRHTEMRRAPGVSLGTGHPRYAGQCAFSPLPVQVSLATAGIPSTAFYTSIRR